MNIGHIIRFNISLNDGQALVHLYGSGQTQSVIHNNLFYNINPQVSLMLVEGRPSDIELTQNIFHIPDMVKWVGVKSIGRLVFSKNTLLKKKLFIPKRGNTFRKTVYSDLFQLLNRQAYQSGQPEEIIHPDMISEFWNSVVKK